MHGHVADKVDIACAEADILTDIEKGFYRDAAFKVEDIAIGRSQKVLRVFGMDNGVLPCRKIKACQDKAGIGFKVRPERFNGHNLRKYLSLDDILHVAEIEEIHALLPKGVLVRLLIEVIKVRIKEVFEIVAHRTSRFLVYAPSWRL